MFAMTAGLVAGLTQQLGYWRPARAYGPPRHRRLSGRWNGLELWASKFFTRARQVGLIQRVPFLTPALIVQERFGLTPPDDPDQFRPRAKRTCHASTTPANASSSPAAPASSARICATGSRAGPRRPLRRQFLHRHASATSSICCGHPRFEFMRHDVTFPLYVEVDEIYNLACPASPIHYQYDPVQTTKTSVHGAINMLGLAKRSSARILQASTSEVYGDPAVHPQTESYWGNVNPDRPALLLRRGQALRRDAVLRLSPPARLEIKVARIFNTYGPRMHPDDGRVVSNFIVQALRGEPITLYGDGSQTRSFCYVDDLIDGLMRLMESPDDFTGPVNLGNPAEFTMRELAELVLELTGACRHGPHAAAAGRPEAAAARYRLAKERWAGRRKWRCAKA